MADDVLPVKVTSPPYTAVMVCVPAPKVESGKVAVPREAQLHVTTDAVPIVFAPSLKVTVPLGDPPFWATTVATKLTVWSTMEGFGLELSVVVVGVRVVAELMFSRMVTPPTARSGLPSRLKSPTAMPGPSAPKIRAAGTCHPRCPTARSFLLQKRRPRCRCRQSPRSQVAGRHLLAVWS